MRRTVRQMAKGKFKLRPTVHVHVMRTDIQGYQHDWETNHIAIAVPDLALLRHNGGNALVQ